MAKEIRMISLNQIEQEVDHLSAGELKQLVGGRLSFDSCTTDSCTDNTGSCTENNCTDNSGSCGTNNCTDNEY